MEVDFTSECVRLRGRDYDIEVRERMAVVKGVSRWELHTIRNGRKKVLYVWLSSGKGYECGDDAQEELASTVAHVRRISLSIGDYVNVMLAGRFLFDYAILGREVLVFVVPGRREVYVDKEKDAIAIYVV